MAAMAEVATTEAARAVAAIDCEKIKTVYEQFGSTASAYNLR